MSKDTDKLAAEMRNLKPSKASRAAGMDAAMAAFGAEFAGETTSAKTDDSANLEENSTSTQGLTDAPRPTGKSTTSVRATSRRVETMSKFKTAFNFKPQTMMMAGTCSAALIAAMIVIPNMGELAPMDQIAEPTPVAAKSGPVETAPVAEAPVSVEQAPVVDRPADEEDVVVVTGTKKSTDAQPAVTPSESLQTQTVEVERRVLKSPGQTIERTVPSKTSTITRRVVKTPAATVERSVPAVTEQHERQIAKDDGTFETVTETVVVAPATVEYVTVPPVYETVQETVAVQEAATELVTIPPTYETVRDTIEIAPDGTQTVISSEVVSKAAAPQNGITTVNDLLSNTRIGSSEAENRKRVKPFQQTANQLSGLSASQPGWAKPQGRTQIMIPGVDKSAALGPLPKTLGGLTVEEVASDPIIVKGGNTPQQFTVFNGVSEQVIESKETTVSQTGEILARVLIPAEYETITKQVLVAPAKSEQVTIPAVTKDVTVRKANGDGTFTEVVQQVVVQEERIDYIVTPPQYETRTERVLIAPSREEWKPDSQAINAEAIVQKPVPPKIYLRDDDGNVVREFENRDAFEKYKSNLTTVVSETPVSTFSVDVDTASYSFLRASINRGQLPPRESIRLEEIINYFPYDYDAPKSSDQPFKANVTVTQNPWNADKKLMHIGIKGYVPKQTEKPRSNLVFLIDTSGSMNRANKLPLLVNSFKLLLNTLDEDDTVSILAYASASGTVLEPTSVKNKDEILAALNNLRAGGSTAGAAGLELAYQKAQESFDDEGVNRVILATDGDFNVGFSSPEDMKTFIKEKRETGIFLSVLGFGMGNYNDHLMQSLAQNGNGVAAYIDNLAEANKVLANEAGSALFTIAKDVKIQVEFNPATVAEYRLLGYETRALKRQDFNNDKVDAGEIGAGHTVTAIYEMTPVDSPAITVDKLRYVSEKSETVSAKSDELAFVKIRHKLPDADKSTLQTFPIGKRQEKSLRRAGDDVRFAAAVAAVGQKLRGDIAVEDYSYEDAIKLAQGAKGEDENGYRAEFIQMVKLIDTMAK